MTKIDKEGYGIITKSCLVLVLFAVVIFFLLPRYVFYVIAVVFLLLMTFIIRFFRVPYREQHFDKDLVFAPADGTVVVSERVFVDEFFQDERIQVSIFMSIWNVHANWFPVGGRVDYFRHHNGDFMVAWHPKSSLENERTSTVVTTKAGTSILFRQIAGSLAKRIVSYAKEGKDFEQNSRCGFIKFGSRLDIFLPLDSEVLVQLGDKTVGSQTPIAKLTNQI